MSKVDAYERPDGQEIRKKRKLKEWTPEDLAEKAKVGVSTVTRAERGLRVQLRNLSKIAAALDVRLETIAPELHKSQSVQVLDRWGHEFDLMTEAKESIVIVDSFFSEYGRLSSALRARSKTHPEKDLKIELFMASPDTIFGAQRLREMQPISIVKSMEGIIENPKKDPMERTAEGPVEGTAERPKKPLEKPLTKSARDGYTTHFEILVESTRNAAGEYVDNGNIQIFEYFCTPGLRVVAIDSLHYIFGWFPLFAQNPAHTCFYLKDENLEGADVDLLHDIRIQIDGVREASTPARKRP